MATTQNIRVTLSNESGVWIATRDGQSIESITIEKQAATLTFDLESDNTVFAEPWVKWGGGGKPDWISDPYAAQSLAVSLAIADNEAESYPSFQLVLQSPPGGAELLHPLPIELLQPEALSRSSEEPDAQLPQYDVTVSIVDGEELLLGGDVDEESDSIPVNTVAAMIRFTLETPGWTFDVLQPLVWVEEEKPAPQPPSFSKALDTTLTSFNLLDVNNNRDQPAGVAFSFWLRTFDENEVLHLLRAHKVSTLGKARKGFDPTIINQQPDPPGPGQGGLKLIPALALA